MRAVRAAAEMGEAIAVLNEELATAHGVTIRVRTGVHTGEVVVTEHAVGQLAAGDAMNVAARLEQAAGEGEILIGADTYRLVRDAVLVERLDPLTVKGKAEPLTAYRVQKVDPAAAGFARRLDAPMVGRERELSLLLGAFDRTVSDHACQLFTVLGVGGVGKSRLLEAFVDALGDGATVLRGRCLPYGDGITFLPVVEAVREAAGLTGAETAEEARARIAALVVADEHRDRIAAQVGQVVGIEGEEAAQEETLWAIRRLLEAIAATRPLVFLIDDVQWAEPTMLALIEHVADWSVDAPILLACMARPELLEARPDWGGGKLNATSISLEPLSEEECAVLITNLLAVDEVAPEVRARVAAAAEGHPLFAEEMLAMLIDEGRLRLVDDVWSPAGDLGELAVPPTTAALLAARIDRLPPQDRELLMAASVVGQVFYRDALDALSTDPDVGGRLVLADAQAVRSARTIRRPRDRGARVPAPPDPRRRVRGSDEGGARRDARTVRRLARGAGARAAGVARLPLRARVPLPRGARHVAGAWGGARRACRCAPPCRWRTGLRTGRYAGDRHAALPSRITDGARRPRARLGPVRSGDGARGAGGAPCGGRRREPGGSGRGGSIRCGGDGSRPRAPSADRDLGHRGSAADRSRGPGEPARALAGRRRAGAGARVDSARRQRVESEPRRRGRTALASSRRPVPRGGRTLPVRGAARLALVGAGMGPDAHGRGGACAGRARGRGARDAGRRTGRRGLARHRADDAWRPGGGAATHRRERPSHGRTRPRAPAGAQLATDGPARAALGQRVRGGSDPRGRRPRAGRDGLGRARHRRGVPRAGALRARSLRRGGPGRRRRRCGATATGSRRW